MDARLVIEHDEAGPRLRGRMGFAEAATAASRWRELVGAGEQQVEVDLSGLERPDSATLAVLLAWSARAQHAGIRLRYREPPPGLLALARLCGTEQLLLA